MRFSKSCVLGFLAVVAMVGCVDQEDTQDELPLTGEVSLDPDAPPVLMQVPPELSLDASLDDPSILAGRCSTLDYCRDPLTHFPSYCAKSGCSRSEAFYDARALCRNNCGNIDCSILRYLGRC